MLAEIGWRDWARAVEDNTKIEIVKTKNKQKKNIEEEEAYYYYYYQPF